jgi:hypothetical protein
MPYKIFIKPNQKARRHFCCLFFWPRSFNVFFFDVANRSLFEMRCIIFSPVNPFLFHRLRVRIARGLGDRRRVVGDRVDRTCDRWALFELVLERKKKNSSRFTYNDVTKAEPTGFRCEGGRGSKHKLRQPNISNLRILKIS